MSTAPSTLEGGQFGRFEILLAERRLRVDGQPVTLGSRAFDLLAALVTRRDRVVPKDELIEVVWPGLVVEDNNLQVQISALRKVLGTQAIATVPGRGYQFTVAAAARANELRRASAPATALAGAVRPSRLLVADDNKVNRLLLCRSLELMSHHVASVDNGRTALEKLRSEPFDLLLLDLEMPELDGFGLLEQRAEDATLREVPVIVTSSLEGAAQVARCIELGADDFLHKPVNPMLLKARVDSSLERKRLRDRQRELLARLAPGSVAGQDSGGAPPPARRVTATLLSARLHDVDALTEAESPQAALDTLNDWTTLLLDAAEGQGGHVIRMTGDSIVVVFGAAESSPVEVDAPARAVRAALEMLHLVAMFNAERSSSGKAALAMGIGIATGGVVAGDAGTPRRSAFACIGAAEERAGQLAALATSDEGPILIDHATHLGGAGGARASPAKSAVLAGSPEAVAVHSMKAL